MSYAKPTPGDDGTFQVNPDDLIAAYPQFFAAGDAIRNALKTLNSTLKTAEASWDGDAQKNLQSLGNLYTKNLGDLAGALDEIATRLRQSANAVHTVEGSNMRMF